MQADKRFLGLPPVFWANVRTISQEVGYTNRGAGTIRVPTAYEIKLAYRKLGLNSDHLFDKSGTATEMGQRLLRTSRRVTRLARRSSPEWSTWSWSRTSATTATTTPRS